MCNFFLKIFWQFFFLIQVFLDPGATKPPKRLDDIVTDIFLWAMEKFFNFLMSQIWAIFDKTCFFQVFFFKKLLSFF